MMRRNKRSAIESLICSRLEGISGAVFADYSKQITELAGKRPGIYALYRRNELYYVGLATNLRNRIKNHLHDKHSGKWDTFSLFIVRHDAPLKDLEAMTIRIAKPKGNSVRGSKIPSLKRDLKRLIDALHKKRTRDILGLPVKPDAPVPDRKSRKPTGKPKHGASLAAYVDQRFRIRLEHEGKRYIATVREDGTIRFSAQGAGSAALLSKVFYSPSLAAKAVLGYSVNGWTVWRFKQNGKLVPLDSLRKR